MSIEKLQEQVNEMSAKIAEFHSGLTDKQKVVGVAGVKNLTHAMRTLLSQLDSALSDAGSLLYGELEQASSVQEKTDAEQIAAHKRSNERARNMFGSLDNQIMAMRAKLDEFAKKLQGEGVGHIMSAMEWSVNEFATVADLEVATRVQDCIENGNYSCEDLYQEILKETICRAASPSSSSMTTANLMDRARTKSWAQLAARYGDTLMFQHDEAMKEG